MLGGWREVEGGGERGGGVILSHCLIGHSLHWCGAGVTDARGCSARLGAALPQSTCQKCCSAHAQCMWQLQQLGGWGASGWGRGEAEGVMEGCGRCSWWRRTKHIFSSQGLSGLQRPDLSAAADWRLQTCRVRGSRRAAGFREGFMNPAVTCWSRGPPQNI